MKQLEIKIGVIERSWSTISHPGVNCSHNSKMFVFRWPKYGLFLYLNKNTAFGKQIQSDIDIENISDNYNQLVLKKLIKYMALDEFNQFLDNVSSESFRCGRDSIRRDIKGLLNV